MNPNSANQRWSKWTFNVQVTGRNNFKTLQMDELKQNMSRFLRKLFGTTAGQMQIKASGGKLSVEVLLEGSDVVPQDPAYVTWVQNNATAFFVQRLGSSTQVNVTGELKAGSWQDGRPADQLIILPTIEVT